jgi:hypothetical protein
MPFLFWVGVGTTRFGLGLAQQRGKEKSGELQTGGD